MHGVCTFPSPIYGNTSNTDNANYIRGVLSSELLSSSELDCGFVGTGAALGGAAFAFGGTFTAGVSSSEPKEKL
jgi:hypothetical protein